jgi:hypothetical protein
LRLDYDLTAYLTAWCRPFIPAVGLRTSCTYTLLSYLLVVSWEDSS